jgi:hypothetical protein
MDPRHCPPPRKAFLGDSASSGAIEASLLAEAKIDPLPTVSTNLSLFLVPTICPFTFELPSLNNLGMDDMSNLAVAYGPIVAEWAHVMLLAHKQGEMALTLYNYLEGQDSLARHLGARAGELSLHINKNGPCLSAVSCTSSSHPDDCRTLLSRLGAAIAATMLPPAPVLQQVVITSGDKTKEKNNMATGYNTLLTIMICEYDPNSDVLSAFNLPMPTEAFKPVSKLTTKDEHVHALKNILDTNKALRVPRSEHNMLVMSRQYNDVDPLVPTAIITGIYAKTEIKDMKSASTQFTLIHFRATGKDTTITLRKEPLAYQLEDAVGKTESNKSKKRTTFSSTEMFVDLDSIVSYLANIISAFQCMFNCAATQVS